VSFFLAEKNPNAAKKAAQTISYHFSILKTKPEIGRSIDEISALRELIIPFGNSGYVALYRFDEKSCSVYVLAFRHQKEAGY
jgi:plasmid stabilization system protein ParE